MEVLQLKRGCKVMLGWNLSDSLKNGSVGAFTGVLFISDLQLHVTILNVDIYADDSTLALLFSLR